MGFVSYHCWIPICTHLLKSNGVFHIKYHKTNLASKCLNRQEEMWATHFRIFVAKIVVHTSPKRCLSIVTPVLKHQGESFYEIVPCSYHVVPLNLWDFLWKQAYIIKPMKSHKWVQKQRSKNYNFYPLSCVKAKKKPDILMVLIDLWMKGKINYWGWLVWR